MADGASPPEVGSNGLLPRTISQCKSRAASPAKVKVTYAEVGAVGHLNGLLQYRQERLLDVV